MTSLNIESESVYCTEAIDAPGSEANEPCPKQAGTLFIYWLTRHPIVTLILIIAKRPPTCSLEWFYSSKFVLLSFLRINIGPKMMRVLPLRRPYQHFWTLLSPMIEQCTNYSHRLSCVNLSYTPHLISITRERFEKKPITVLNETWKLLNKDFTGANPHDALVQKGWCDLIRGKEESTLDTDILQCSAIGHNSSHSCEHAISFLFGKHMEHSNVILESIHTLERALVYCAIKRGLIRLVRAFKAWKLMCINARI